MNIKKLSALILSGAFVLSFAGCGNSEPAATVPSYKDCCMMTVMM